MSRYTVKQVAALTGVPAATLRAWERRYAVVEPARTDARYRLYDDDDLARLHEMAALVAAGAPASLAAQEVVSTAERRSERVAEAATAAGEEPVALLDQGSADLIRAARTFDAGLLDRVLDDAFSRGSFERVVEGWLMPSLTDLGAAWTSGRIDVAGEHFVSSAVLRRLSLAFEAAGVRVGSPVAVIGLPPGAQHEIGAVAFAAALRRQGVDVRYLGADLPRESWTHAQRTTRPAAVVISVPTLADARHAGALVEDLRAGLGGSLLFIGGGGAGTIAQEGELLPLAVTEAALQVSQALHA